MENNHEKNISHASYYYQLAEDQMKKQELESTLNSYTLALVHVPVVHEEDSLTLNGAKEEYPLAFLYGQRSLAMFRSKRYQDCLNDINRSFANGKHDNSRYVSLVTRMAWSYWHLKNYRKCLETVETASIDESNASQEFKILKQLLTKSKSKEKIQNGNNNHSNSQQNGLHSSESVLQRSNLYCGENKTIKGVSACAVLNKDEKKGRYLTANKTIKPGYVLVDEEVYAGVLNKTFSDSHCNYCFRDCRSNGIPCFGCTKAVYCDEECRLRAWRSYHWLECSMWPVINTLDGLTHLALRVLLCTAHETAPQSQKSSTCFTSIAEFMQSSINPLSNKGHGKKKSHRNTKKQASTNHLTNSYNRDYWSVFCLQTHEENHSKVTLEKCGLFATYLAKVLQQIVSLQKRKFHKQSSTECPPNSAKETAFNVQNALKKLSLNGFFGDNDASLSVDLEKFRQHTANICENAAADAPAAKLRHQHCFLSKDLPKTFQDIVSYLLRRHLLQLHTNCQAIFDIVVDKSQVTKEVSQVSQQRLASALFTSTSLLNHSCNPNTVLSFVGRRIMVRAAHSITDGSEITHCYGPSMSRHSFKDRQRMLKEQYHFDCECLTCAKYKSGDHEDQVYLQQFTAYLCEQCEGPILIQDVSLSADTTVQGKCANEACKRVHDLSEAHKSLNMIVSMSNSLSQRLIARHDPRDLVNLEKCLHRLKSVLFRHHHAIGSLHDQLAYHYTEFKDYVKAAEHVTKSLKITSMRFGAKSVEAAQEMFKLGNLCFHCQKFKESHKFLTKSLDIHKDLTVFDRQEQDKAKTILLAIESLTKTNYN